MNIVVGKTFKTVLLCVSCALMVMGCAEQSKQDDKLGSITFDLSCDADNIAESWSELLTTDAQWHLAEAGRETDVEQLLRGLIIRRLKACAVLSHRANDQAMVKETRHLLRSRAESVLADQFATTVTLPDERSIEVLANQYYEENIDQFEQPSAVRLYLIFRKAPDVDDKKKQRAMLKEVMTQVKNRDDFKNAALKHSQHPSRLTEGDLGWQVQAALNDVVAEFAFNSTVSSGDMLIHEQSEGVYLYMYSESRPAKQSPYEEVKDIVYGIVKSRSYEEEYSAVLSALLNSLVERDGEKLIEAGRQSVE